MLFYSYAEFVIGLVAIFYFTSKIFSITKYKLYFALSLIFIISTASFACFIKSDQRYVILTRPQKVRPKKSNFGGRYFYVKIQL